MVGRGREEGSRGREGGDRGREGGGRGREEGMGNWLEDRKGCREGQWEGKGEMR